MNHRTSAVPASATSAAPTRHLRLVSPNGTPPRSAQDQRMLTVTFQVAEQHAPALRSALEEITDAVATRVEGKFQKDTEHSLTCALIGLGQLRAALYPQVPAGDANYRGRR